MSAQPSAAVLLVNLGTPSAPTPSAVRRFLAEFLGDRRVVELPRALWLPLLHGVILRLRPRRSARAYAKIWTAQGSPLLVHSQALREKLDMSVAGSCNGRVRVALAMRYGEPALAETITQLHAQGVRHLLVLPLYPQYSATSTGSVFDAATAALQRLRWPAELRFVNDYHDLPEYICALARRVENHWTTHGRAPRLLLSFHGIPERCVSAGDPYLQQCTTTARLLRERLGLSEENLLLTFQSRVGRAAWLKPYTDAVLAELPGTGTRHVQVLCPGFAVDCLETLEEIALQNREHFLAAGGERLDYIPALNSGADHVQALRALIARHTHGWPEFVALEADIGSSRPDHAGA